MKKYLCIIVLLLANWSLAIDFVDLRIVGADGKEQIKRQTLQKMPDGAKRLVISKKDLSGKKSIDVLTDEARAKTGEDGYWVLSDGRLGHFTRENGTLKERRNPMPLYGVKKGDKALLGIVKGLKYEFSMNVDAKGGAYEIYPSFLVSQIGFEPYEDAVIDFYELEGKDANYSAMGRIYRKYQLDRGEVKPLKERVKEYPTLKYSVESMFFRMKFGVKEPSKVEHQTPENEPPIVVSYTFDDFANAAREFKAMGIDKIEMCFVGWNSGGFDGRFPDLFPVEEKFGGEKKMREAIEVAHSLGYQTVCHVCNTDFYRIAKRFDEYSVAKLPDGSLRPYAHMAGGRAYNPCFECVNDRYIDEDYTQMRALGLKGTHHIDVTSCITPYPCFDKHHPCNRQQTADAMNKIGWKCKKYFGGFGSEGPCDHVAQTLDYALYVWAYPRWVGRDNPLVDRLVPIWQIAYHGIILSNPYYSTIDYTYENDTSRSWLPYALFRDKTTRRLKMAEFNGRPTFYFANYRKLGYKPIKEAYDEYQPMKHLQYEFMENHSEIAPNVFLTEFSNGESIITNYTDKDFDYKGNKVKAKDYLLIK